MRYRASVALLTLLLTAGCHRESGEASGAKESGGKSAGEKSSGGKSASAGGGSESSQSGDKSSDQKGASTPTDVVKIAREDQAKAGIQVAAVQVRSMPRTLEVAGQVAMDDRHTDHIGAITDGRIEQVYVLPGDQVRRGQTLATLHSHSVHETVAALTQAFADVRLQQVSVRTATDARDRYSKLFTLQAASLEEKQRSEQELAQAQKSLVDAEANVRAEREHLAELLQVSPASLQPGTLTQRELIPIRAATAGYVITRSITPAQVVNTGDEAFVVSNLSTVWVNAAVNERDVPEVRRGAVAHIRLGTGSSEAMDGTVSVLGDLVDPQTRTLPVRISVPNAGIRLRPGMFVTASISESAKRIAMYVPADALQDVNGFKVVFVTPDGVNFQARTVKTGVQTGGLIEVLEGLQPTDHVVVSGAFMVKGALLKNTVGEG